jgi:hypothetical protein
MIEREMEDLLAAFPDEFFPRHSFVLKGRQQSFAGVGRFDLLFEDQFHTTILMELKARPAKYEDATQLAKYKEELERRGDENVLMWLVADHIPKSVCEFLDHIGVQYSEIHFVEFRRAAQRHGIQLASESGTSASAPDSALIAPESGHPRMSTAMQRGSSARSFSTTIVETGPRVTAPAPLRWKAIGRDLALLNLDGFDEKGFAALVDGFQESVPSGKNAHLVADLRNWSANPRSTWSLGSCSSLLRWVTTSGWKAAVPAAGSIWEYMFGRPAPTWYVWDQSRRKYDFDSQGWKVWYESLPH